MITRKPSRILTSSIAALAALASTNVHAVDVFWDRGSATNAWGTGGNWSPTDVAAAATGAVPANGDVAVFNITALTAAQTIDLGADRTIAGLRFVSSGTVAIQGGGANRLLILGGTGITKTGTGAVTIGSGTNNQNVGARLSADQTWANNNNTGTIVVNNTVTASSAANRVLTLGGSSTAANQINAVISNNGAGVFSIAKTGASLWLLSGANTFTGGVTLSAGTVRVTNNAGLGTGTLTFGSGSTGRLQINNGITIGNNIVIDSGVTGVVGQGLIDVNGTGKHTINGTITLNGNPSAGGTFRTSNTLGDELVINGAVNGTTVVSGQRDGRVVFAGGGAVTGNYTVAGTLLAGANNGIPQGWTPILGGSAAGTLDMNGFSQTLAGVTLGNPTNAFAGTVTLRSGTLTLNGDITALASTAAGNNTINGFGGGSIDFGATARNIAVNDTTSAVDLVIADTTISTAGGLTKTGTGNLALNNATFSGALAVSSGAVSVGTLGASATALSLGGVTINSGGLFAGGTVTATGTNTINYIPVGAAPAAGNHPLISYTGTTPGTANFSLGTVGPRMVVGGIVDTGSAIALNVTANDSVTWTGSIDAAWDINTTQNWQTTLGTTATGYLEGDHVKFDDTGLNSNITLGVAVNPARVEFTHTTPNTYSISGAGSLAGGGDIVHSGTGSTRIATLNNAIAGPIFLSAGSLELDHGAAANQTVLNNARVNVSAGATLRLTSDNVDFNYARPISGGGTVVIDPNSGGTAGPRGVTISGRNDLFSGTFDLTPTAAGGTFRMIANDLGALGTATIDVNDGAQFWPQNGQDYSNSIKITGTGFNEVAGGAPASIAATTTGGVYIGTGAALFSYAGIGAIRGDNQTLAGNIDLEGHAKISAHNSTLTLSGVISGDSSETLVVGGGSDANTVVFTGNNTYAGRTWVNGGSSNAAARNVILQIGNNTTTGSLGTGEVVLYANALHSAFLRFQRTDGYTLATGQNIIAAAAASADLAGRANLQLNVTGAGFTSDGNTVDVSDGAFAGNMHVGTNISGASVNFNGATVVDAGSFFLGEQANNSATVNQAGTTSVTLLGRLQIAHWSTETSTYNLTSGTVDLAGLAPATFPFATGTSEQLGGIYVGVDGTGMLNQTGGTITTNFMVLDNRGATNAGANMVTGVDTYQMDGGTLVLKGSQGIISRHASTAVNLNGGTIQAAVGSIPALDSNTITVQAGGVTLDGNSGNAFTLYGGLLGTGTLTLTGNGTLRTADSNATSTTAGGLGAGLGGSLNAVPVSFTAGNILESNRSAASAPDVWTGAITGAGSIVKNNTGILTLAGNLSGLTGGITVSGGILRVTGTVAATQDITVADNAELSAEKTIDDLTIGSVTGGSIGFNPNTVATLAVDDLAATGTNVVNFDEVPTGAAPWTVLTYATSSGLGTWALGSGYRGGSVTDTGFSVQVDNVVRKPLTWTGATNGVWDLNTTQNWNDTTPAAENFFQADDVTFGDGPTNVAVSLTGALRPWKVTVNAATNNYTLTSSAGNELSGPIGIEKSGASTLTLVGQNSNTRKTIISGGAISIANAASLGSGVAGNDIELSTGGKLIATAAITTGANRVLNLAAGGGVLESSNAAAQTVTVNSAITGSAPLEFRTTGTGAATVATFSLSGNNSGYTGAMSLTATSTGIATLTIANPTAVPSASSITINHPANAVTSGNANTLSLTNGVTMPTATTLRFTSALPTAVLSLRSGMALGGTVNINGPITLAGDSIIQFNGAAASVTNYNGAISETTPGAFVQSPLQAFSNVLFLRGTGLHNINNTITLPSAGSTVAVTDGATAVLNAAGSNYASANSVFGTLRLGVDDAIPTSARLVIGQAGDQATTFDMNGFNQTVAGLEWQAVNGNLLTKGISNSHATATSTFTLNQATAPLANYNGTISGRINFVKEGAATTTLVAPASTFTGNVTVNNGTLAVTGAGNAAGANGTLGASNVAGKTVTVGSGATLSFGTNDVFGNGVGNANLPAVSINGGTLTSTRYNVLGALTLNGATLTQSSTDGPLTYEGFQFRGDVTVGGVAASTISTGNGKANHLNANTTFTVADATGSAASDLLVSAPLRDQSAGFGSAAGGLTKEGEGTLEISSASIYTGPTVVNNGTLVVSGSLTGSAVSVNGDAVLSGSGSITGSVTVSSGATLAPGASPGILDTGSLNLDVGSTLAIELNGATVDTDYDQVNVTGSITLGGALSLSVGYAPVATDKFWIGLNDGSDQVLGAFSNVPVTDVPNNSGLINISGVDYTVYYGADFATDATTGGNDILVAVPEPGSAVMLMSGIGMLLGLQRRRRK